MSMYNILIILISFIYINCMYSNVCFCMCRLAKAGRRMVNNKELANLCIRWLHFSVNLHHI